MWWVAMQHNGAPLSAPPNTTRTHADKGSDEADTVAVLDQKALMWWALRFTPYVAQLDEAVVLEVSGSERLFGGRSALMQQLLVMPSVLHHSHEAVSLVYGQGPSSLVALANLRQGSAKGSFTEINALPLVCLTAAQTHLPVLQRLGCQTWGDVQALPRGGVLRRFGQGLLNALDVAYGRAPDVYPWASLPAVFDSPLELPALAESTTAMLWGWERLFGQLRWWLQARQLAVLAVELVWTLDERRLAKARSDQPWANQEVLVLRTAVPSVDMGHLMQLAREHLAKVQLKAPVCHMRLRSLETAPLPDLTHSLLPEDLEKGGRFSHLVERLCARLGPTEVQMMTSLQDHRPERMQHWTRPSAQQVQRVEQGVTSKKSAHQKGGVPKGVVAGPTTWDASLYPTWLLHDPLPLAVVNHRPHYQGPLRLLVGPQRLEAAWWSEQSHQALALRDYFIAHSAHAGLLWVYRERLQSVDLINDPVPVLRWFLHGVYG